MSPSMDILISSNLERLLYSITQDPEEVRTFRYFNATQVLKRRDLETEEIIRRLRQRGYYVRPD